MATERPDAGTLVKRALAALDDMRAKLDAVEHARREPIAIVGIGCRFPGDVDSADAFWTLLADGRDAITEVPPDRWDAGRYHDPDPTAPGRIVTRHGGFVGGVKEFDAEFFGIAPREAACLDPQQRLLLEVAWEALEDAALPPAACAGRGVGVFVGIATADFAQLLMTRPAADIDAYLATGTAHSMAAGRLSYTLGLVGPSVAVDTACSSSLVALHLAAQSLRGRECDVALAGGVSRIVTPAYSIAFSRGRMLAADGRCKTFDASADGFGRGEGCGVVVLKRLSDALADGDDIVALVRGSAMNQDGRTSGLTVPSAASQQAVVRAALAAAGVKPDDVGYVEAHGTGTALGDPIELAALGAVFADRTASRPLVVGSVKTNIGHVEAAAGIAGVIKTALALRHGTIPRHLHFRTPNPNVDWRTLPVTVPVDAMTWPGGARRVAGVSSFGFSGTNAHVVLESAPPVPSTAAAGADALHVLPLSARSDPALRALAARYADHLANPLAPPLADICVTAGAGRAALDHRLALVATSRDDAAARLAAFAAHGTAASVHTGRVRHAEPSQAAFLFAGHGPLHARTTLGLRASEPAFRGALDRCDEILMPLIGESIVKRLEADGRVPLDHGAIAPPALFAVEYALAALWRAWGVKPFAVMGHGLGEYVAACVAGVFRVEDALRIVAAPTDAALRACLATVTLSAPAMPIVSSLTGRLAGPEIATPDYWCRDLREPVRFAGGIRTLHDEGVRVCLEIGAAATLSALARAARPDTDDMHVIPTLAPGAPDAGALRETAAALFTSGVDVSWTALAGGHARRRRGLPTYPFQRRTYWPDHVGIDDAPGAAVAAEPMPPAYEVVWRAAPPAAGAAVEFPDAATIAARVDMAALAAAADLEAYVHALDALRPLAEFHVVRALETLGFRFDAGRAGDIATLADELGIAARHRGLFARLLGILAAAGVIVGAEGAWGVARTPERRAVSVSAAAADAELALLTRCGARLADVLRGEVDPLTLLFADQDATVGRIYGGSAGARVMNGAARDAIAAAVAGAPSDRRLRVLEIGAGTGSTTAAVLEALPAERTDYVFTDVSQLFVARARERFAATASMRFATLDIERDPLDQGLGGERFDVVIAANVLHATRDLRATLARVRGLLAPGGLLVLVEVTAARPWVDLTFGLSEGWWSFTDRELRAGSPLLDVERWRAVLGRSGFVSVATLEPPRTRDGAALDQVVILARADVAVATGASTRSARWLVAASHAAGDPFAAALVARGVACELDEADAAAVARHLAGTPLAGVICVVDGPPEADAPAHAERLAGALLDIAKTLAARDAPSPRLWLVTRGAAAHEARPAVAHAPLWALGRVVSLEYPALWGGAIDLAPARESGDVDRALDRILAGGAEDQVALRGDGAFVPRLVARPVADAALTFRSDATYLVTGAFGALGLALVSWMIGRGARHVALVGRRGAATDESRAALGRFEAAGARVLALAADVGDAAALAHAMQRIRVEMPPLRGVFHAAGAGRARPLADLDRTDVAAEFRPKAHGAWLLNAATRGDALDHFVLFSSASAVWGARGQAHYAAANHFMDALARSRHADGRPALSVNWGLFAGGGMADGAYERWLVEVGFAAMPPARAFDAMAALLVSGVPQATVAAVDWARFRAIYQAARRRPLLDELAGAPTPRAAARAEPTLRARLAAAPAAARHELLVDAVQRTFAAALGFAALPDHDARRGFFDLGMDSLMAVELRDRLQRELGVTLASTVAFDHPNVDALARYLARELGVTVDTAPARAAAPTVDPSPAGTIDDRLAQLDRLLERLP